MMHNINISLALIAILLSTLVADNSVVLGEQLYNKSCAQCHGERGEKKAFGRSLIIDELDKDTIAFMLKGYRDKSYGGDMKYFMTHYAKELDDTQIDSVSKYIGKK